MEGKFVSYLRISTASQGINGLGIDAQREAITNYLNGGRWKLLAEFKEEESGKRDDNRPQLRAALEMCRRRKATLLIAKLDRLSRNVHFITGLLESKVDFKAVDMPFADKTMIQVRAVFAEHEREMISKRTRDALQAAKARGIKLGNPIGLSEEARIKGTEAAKAARIRKADEYARSIGDIILRYKDEGLSLRATAKKLTEEEETTPRGGCNWTPTTVKNVLARIS